MSASEASQQANRAEMDPRRLVVVSYLVFGIVLVLFFGKMIELAFGAFSVNNGELLTGTGIKTANVIGFLITAGLAGYAWTSPRIKSLSLEVATELMRVIASGDAARLQTIPGVGRRFAERMVVECREAAAALAAEDGPPRLPLSAVSGSMEEAVSALVNLGYKRPEAERAVQQVGRPGAPVEEVIRAALQGLVG